MKRPSAASAPGDDSAQVSKALSWIFLLGFMFVSSCARGVYSAHGVVPSLRFEALCTMSTITFVWYWLREQCRPHKVAFPLDMALFASSLSVIVLPYYLWRFERWRGILKVLALAGSAAAAELWSAIVHFILVVGK